jgi:hypothetical protein
VAGDVVIAAVDVLDIEGGEGRRVREPAVRGEEAHLNVCVRVCVTRGECLHCERWGRAAYIGSPFSMSSSALIMRVGGGRGGGREVVGR